MLNLHFIILLFCLSYQQSLDIKRMFIRYISHEIRTPLNTVCLGLKFMFDDFNSHGESRSRLENLSDIRESCDTAVNILNELLTLDKLESGILMLEKKPLLAWSFISEVVRPFVVQVRG